MVIFLGICSDDTPHMLSTHAQREDNHHITTSALSGFYTMGSPVLACCPGRPARGGG